MTGTSPTLREQTRQLVADHVAAANDRTNGQRRELRAPDAVFHLHLGGEELPSAAATAEALKGVFEAWPDYHVDVVRTTVRDDLAVLEFDITGTLATPFPLGDETGVPTGVRARFGAVDILRCDGGRIVRQDTYVDVVAMRRALGLNGTPRPAGPAPAPIAEPLNQGDDMTADTTDALARTERLAAAYGAAWDAHDLDAIIAMHTDDMVFHLHLEGSDPVASPAVRDVFAYVFEAWPDYHCEIHRTTVREDLAILEYDIVGTLEKPFPAGDEMGVPTGTKASFGAIDVLHCVDGKVQRKDTWVDGVAMRRALGLSA
ncbi:MAG TPA: nuclear transport factor 2 family protein [Baekduia sp.]|uniref:ester cyclase n=1 Tax=Baekduia sp. TaxID=2600305 RepID=UPI002D784844|nr:nuclear transport factor 2 family protein [Baekduia sp.]HET6507609.1 nuclear transport factor 2 family protein [Baekduia sp.]